jgi:pimeloyl-ACP methyl ester carboxylesterase
MRLWHLLAAGLLLLLLVLALGPGFTPPAILPGGSATLDLDQLHHPPATAVVELEVEPGIVLRGIFVPADAGAPVVVHLLESSGSVTPTTYRPLGRDGSGFQMPVTMGERGITWQLADRGLASLIVDYRGVGPSDGARDPDHLAEDARVIYEEALRRAGGREERVVLRGTSIGCLAAGLLLKEGWRPAGMVLIAPVRSESVARHFAHAVYSRPLALLTSPFLGRVVDLDLVELLRAGHVPALVFSPEADSLLPPDEQSLLRNATESAGGTWRSAAWDHFRLTAEARSLLDGEDGFYRRLLPGVPPMAERVRRCLQTLDPSLAARVPEGSAARAAIADLAGRRLHDDPDLLACVALSGGEPQDHQALLEMFRERGDGWLLSRDVDARVRQLDLTDPAGSIPASLVVAVARHVIDVSPEREPGDPPWGLPEVLGLARGLCVPREHGRLGTFSLRAAQGRLTSARTIRVDDEWRRLRVERGLSEVDTCRLLLRALLKGVRVEHGLLDLDDGRRVLRVADEGGWREVDPLILLESRDEQVDEQG